MFSWLTNDGNPSLPHTHTHQVHGPADVIARGFPHQMALPDLMTPSSVRSATYLLLQTILQQQRESPILHAMTNASNLALPTVM
jgi:hypothetical protein